MFRACLRPVGEVFHQSTDAQHCLVPAHHACLSCSGCRIGIVGAVVRAAPVRPAHTGAHSHPDHVEAGCHAGLDLRRNSGNTAGCCRRHPAGSRHTLGRLGRSGPDHNHHIVYRSPAVSIAVVPRGVFLLDHCMPFCRTLGVSALSICRRLATRFSLFSGLYVFSGAVVARASYP